MTNLQIKRNKIRIGVDFDGVLAYNPFRILRAPVSWFKSKILGVKRLKFFVPQNWFEQLYWVMAHESSVFPAKGIGLLKELAKRDDVELYLITARFRYLSPSLHRWLKRNHMTHIFKSIHINTENKQPHEHKLAVIQALTLDYFIEDNWDIVRYLSGKTKTHIYWIYNVADRGVVYPHKFPYLEKALEAIVDDNQR